MISRVLTRFKSKQTKKVNKMKELLNTGQVLGREDS